MKKIKYLIVVLALLTSVLVAQNKVKIKGIVTDGTNPMSYASVYVLGSTDGGITDDKGNYSFQTKKKGNITIVVSMIGYEKYTAEITITGDKDVEHNIKLNESAVTLKGVVVTASSYGTEKAKGVVLDSRDVYTTPGGGADLFQSLKTLPGVTPVSESAQLYVRGGDPIETITMIDQATLYHPYTFESANGGIFSSLNTATINDIFFSSGGFSAKYGNVLSGVLDVQTKDNPDIATYQVGLSLANVEVMANVPVTDNFGMRLGVRKTFTGPIFFVNGGSERLTVTPTSNDFSALISYKYSKTGRFKISAFINSDKQGVNIDRAEFTGQFNGNSINKFAALQHVEMLSSSIISKTSLSYNEYENNWLMGVLDLKQTDYNYKLRNDLQITLSGNFRLNGGFEAEHRVSKFLGIIPVEDYDLRPDRSGKVIDAALKGTRLGAYAELEILNPLGFSKITASLGIRADYIPELNLHWFDPRASLGYKIDDNTTLALGLGVFRQLPNPRLFAALDGNPNLQPMRAEHAIVSFSRKLSDAEEIRLEAYYKEYKDLPLENTITNYDNSGYGFAKGLDFIFKTNNFLGIEGWFSYGIMDSKRKWMDFENLENSDFNITHNLTIVAKYMFDASWGLGLNCKIATGRPFTPVTGATFHQQYNVYEPVYGSKNSDAYPTYRRVDLRLLYLFQLFNKYSAVFYIEGLNILNFRNLFGYSYSPDYSIKKEIESYFGRRMLVFGVSVTL